MSPFGLQAFSELFGFFKSAAKSRPVQQLRSLCESIPVVAKCIQETTRMAVPTSTITASKVFIHLFALSSYANTAQGSSLSKLPVTEVIPTNNTTRGPIVPNDPPPDCVVNPLDLNFSDSIGGEPSFCFAGNRMGSNDKPCPGPDSCCLCDPGTYRSQENICDTCIPHTKCTRYKSEGDAFNDSVCLQTVDPPEPESVTDSDGVSQTDLPDPQDNVNEPELVDTGQVNKNVTCGEHSSCLNGGSCAIIHSRESICLCLVGWGGVRCEEESLPDQFSIPWPYSLIGILFTLLLLLLLLLLLIGWICFLRRRTKSGSYTVAPMETDIEMNAVKMRKIGSDDESDR